MSYLSSKVKLFIAGYLLLGLWCLQLALFSALAPQSEVFGVSLRVNAQRDLYQVFFDSGRGFNFSDTVARQLQEPDALLEFVFPEGKVRHLRIDPGTRSAEIRISSLCLFKSRKNQTDARSELCWQGKEIFERFRPRRDISIFESSGNQLFITAYGPDPYFENKPEVSKEISEFFSSSYKKSHQSAFVIFAALVLLVLWVTVTKITSLRIVHLTTASLALLTFVYFSFQLSSFIPAFQGPDENEHFGKLISRSLEQQCSFSPAGFAQLLAEVSHLPRNREQKLGLEQVEKLFSLVSPADAPMISMGIGACRYTSPYVALPSIVGRYWVGSSESSAPIYFIHSIRSSNAVVGACIWLSCFIVVLFGRVIGEVKKSDWKEVFRSSGVLSLLYLMLIPQTVWQSSVLSHDTTLIPVGAFFTLSVWFRIRGMSDILLPFYLFLAAGKIPYLLPFQLMCLLHYRDQTWLRQVVQAISRNTKRVVIAILATSFCAALILPSVVYLACGGENCFGLLTSSLLTSPTTFLSELIDLVVERGVLSAPYYFHRDSAFGVFGWLDTFLPTRLATLFLMPVTWIFSLLTPLMFYFLVKLMLKRDFEVAKLIVMFAIVWLSSVFAIYLIFVVMQDWCGLGSVLGCGYQPRYELPLYMTAVLPIFFCIFWVINSAIPGDKFISLRNGVVAVLAINQIIIGIYCLDKAGEITGERYFRDHPAMMRYNELSQL